MDIPSDNGTVRVVLDVKVLEALLCNFPGFELVQMPSSVHDLPTYGVIPSKD